MHTPFLRYSFIYIILFWCCFFGEVKGQGNCPTADAGEDMTAPCSGTRQVQLNGSIDGLSTAETRISWSGGNPLGFSERTSLTSKYTPTAAEIASGSVICTLTVAPGTLIGAIYCDATVDYVEITFPKTPIVNVLQDTKTVCGSDGEVSVDGKIEGDLPGSWSHRKLLTNISTGGSFGSSTNNVATGLYSFSETEIDEGGVYLVLTSSGPCPTKDSARIEIFKPSFITQDDEVVSCSDAITLFPLVNDVTSRTTFLWQIVGANGGGSLTSTNTQRTTFNRGNGNSSPRLRFSVTTPGCEVDTVLIRIVNGEGPNVEVTAAENTCSTSVVLQGTVSGASSQPTAVLTAIDSNGVASLTGFGTITYERSSTVPTQYNARTRYTKPVNYFGLMWLKAVVTVDGCSDVDSTLVNFRINPSVELGSDIRTCSTLVNLRPERYEGYPGSTLQWSVNSTAGNIAPDNAIVARLTKANNYSGPANITFTITPPLGEGCVPATDTRTITFFQIKPTIIAPPTTCSNVVALNSSVNYTGSLTYEWTNGQDAGDFTPTTSNEPRSTFKIYGPITRPVDVYLTATPDPSSGCEPGRDTTNITFTPGIALEVGEPANMCGTIVNIAPKNNTPRALASWRVVPTTAGRFTQPANDTTLFIRNTNYPGLARLILTLTPPTGSACTDPVSDTLLITFGPQTLRADAGDPVITCTDVAVLNGTRSTPAGSRVTWFPLDGGELTGFTTLTPTFALPASTTNRSYRVQMVLSNPGAACYEEVADTVTVTRNALPVITNLTRSIPTCDTSIVLSPDIDPSATGSIYQWTRRATTPGLPITGRFSPLDGKARLITYFRGNSTNSPTLIFTATNPGQGCVRKDSTVVTWGTASDIEARLGADITTCALTVPLDGSASRATDAEFTWAVLGNRGTITPASNGVTATFTPPTANPTGVYDIVLYLAASGGSRLCDAEDSDTIRVTIGTKPVVELNDTLTTCSTVFQLSPGGAPAAGTTYAWTAFPTSRVGSATGSFQPNANSRNISYTRGASANPVTLKIVGTNPGVGCSAADSIAVTFGSGTPADARLGSNPDPSCTTSVPLDARTSVVPTGTRVRWQIEAGNILPHNPNDSLRLTFIKPNDARTSYNVIFNILPLQGSCATEDSDTVTVTFSNTVAADARLGSNPAPSCTTSVPLDARTSVVPTGTRVRWQIEGGNILPHNSNDSLRLTFNKPNDARTSYNLIFSIIPLPGSCATADSDTVTVTFSNSVAADARLGSNPAPSCTISIPLDARASVVPIGTRVRWQIEGGNILPHNPNDSLRLTFNKPNDAKTSYNLIFSILPLPGSCATPDSDTIAVTFSNSVAADARLGTDPLPTCNTSITLDGKSSIAPQGTTVRWQVENGEVLPKTPNDSLSIVFKRPPGIQTTDYNVILFITPIANSCVTPDSDTIKVVFKNDTPAFAYAGNDTVVTCTDRVKLNGTGSIGPGGSDYRWTVIGGAVVPNTTGLLTPTFVRPAGPATVYRVVLEVLPPPLTDCPGVARDTVTVTFVDGIAPVANAGQDIAAGCSTSVNLNGTASTGYAGADISWQIEGGEVLTALAGQISPVFQRPATGGPAYNVILTITPTGSCTEPDTDIVRVTFLDAVPPVADAGVDVAAGCSTSVILNGTRSTLPPTYTAVWTHNGMSSSFTGSTTLTPTFNKPLTGNTFDVVLRITDLSGCFPPDEDIVKVTFVPITVIASSTSPVSTCSNVVNTNATVTNAPAGTTYGWTATLPGTTTTASGSFAAIPGDAINVTYTRGTSLNPVTLTLTATAPGCTPVSSSFNVNFIAGPSVELTVPATVCSTAVQPLASVNGDATGATYTWSAVLKGTSTQAPGSFVPNNSQNPQFTGATPGTTVTMKVVLQVPTCSTPSTAEADVTFLSSPKVILPETYPTCSETVNPTSTVTGTTASTQYQWRAIVTGTSTPAGGVFTPSATVEEVVYTKGATLQDVTLILTAQNPGCTNIGSDSARIINSNNVTFTLPSAASSCTNTVPVEAVVEGNTTGSSFRWTATDINDFPAGGSFSSDNAYSTIYTRSETGPLPVLLKFTVTTTGCTPQSKTTRATFNSGTSPIAKAGNDLNICGSSTPLDGAASTLLGGAPTWIALDGGIITSPNNPLTPVFTKPSQGSLSGYRIELIITPAAGSTCQTVSKDTVLIKFSDPVKVSLGIDQSTCSTTIPLTATPTGNVSGVTYRWIADPSTAGTFSAATGNTNTFTRADDFFGNVNLIVEAAPAGNCSAARDTIVAAFRRPPVVSAGAEQTTCNPSVLLRGTFNGDSTTLRWSSTAGGTFAPANGALFTKYTPPAGFTGIAAITLLSPAAGGCAEASSTTNITFTAKPIVNAGIDRTACGRSVVLAGSVIGATANWTATSTGSFRPLLSSPNAEFTLADAVQPAPTSIVFTYTTLPTPGCASLSDQVLISFSNAVTQVTATADRTSVCSDNADVRLTGLVSGATVSGVWSTSGDGTFIPLQPALSTTYRPGAQDIIDKTVTLTLTSTNNGSCDGASKSIIVLITPKATVNAGVDGTACGNTVTLSGTASSINGLQWRSPAGTFVGGGTLNPTFTLATPTATAVPITLALPPVGGCPEVTDVVSITFVPRAISAGADVVSCSTSAQLNGTITAPFTGRWSTIAAGGFLDASNPVTTFTPTGALPATPISLTFTTAPTEYCKAESDIVLVSFSPGIIANAGADQSICSNNLNVTLAGTVTGNASTGAWRSDGTGTFANAALLSTIYTASAADSVKGFVNLTLTSTSTNGCTNASDVVRITFTPGVTANAGADVSACKNNAVVTLAGVVKGAGTLLWSDGGAGGTFAPGVNMPNPTYTPTAATLATGTVQLTLRNQSSASCVATDAMRITYTPSPIVNAGADQIVCKTSPVIKLSGKVTSTSGAGRWIGGKGNFTPSTDDPAATYTPAPDELTAGRVTLTLRSIESGGCLAVSDDVTINFSDAPVNAGADQFICNNNAKEIPLKATVLGNGTTGSWSTPGGGQFLPNATALEARYVPTPEEVSQGSIVFTFTTTKSNVVCAGALADQMVVTVKPEPVVAVGPDFSICNGQTLKLQASAQNAGKVLWTTNGSGIFTPVDAVITEYTPAASDVSSGPIFLKLTALTDASSNCLPVSDSLLLTISNPTKIDAGDDKSICSNQDVPLAGATVTGGTGRANWGTSGRGTFTPTGAYPSASTYIPSTQDKQAGFVYLILASTNIGGCLSAKDSIKITFNSTFTVNAGLNKTACKNNPATKLQGGVTGGGAGQWATLGDGYFTPDSKALNGVYHAGPGDLQSGKAILYLTSGEASACSTPDSMSITYLPAPDVTAGADKVACSNNATVSLSGTATPGTGVLWTSFKGDGKFSPSNGILNPTYTPGLVDIRNGKATLVISSIPSPSSGCLPVTDTMLITFIKPPQVNAGPDDTKTCNSAPSLSLRGFINGQSSATTWTTDGTGTFGTPGSLTSTYAPSVADRGKNLINFILTADYPGCNPVRDTMKVFLKSSGNVNAGPDFSICANAFAVSLNGAISGGPTRGRWRSSGKGEFLPSDSSLNVSYVVSKEDALGSRLTFTLTSTNGCTPVSDEAVVTIQPNTIADAGADLEVCATAATVTVEGKVVRQTGGVRWEKIGTGVFSTPANALTVTYIPSLADINTGFAKLILTTEGNAQCGLVTDTMTVKIIKAPIADAGKDIDICKGNNGEVNGSIQFGTGKGIWTTTGTGRFQDSTRLQAIYYPSAQDFQLEVFKIILTSKGAEQCGVSTDTIDVIIRPNQGPGNGNLPDLQACSGQSVFLGRAAEAGYAYLWRPNDLLSDSTVSSPTVKVVNPHPTDTTITFTLRISEPTTTCISRDTVVLKVSKNLAVNAGADTSVCAGVPVVIGSQPLPDVDYKWTPTSELSDTSSANPIFTGRTSTARRTIAYYLQATSTTVKCSQRDTVLITVNVNPSVDAGLDTVICSGSKVNIGAQPIAGNTYQWIPASGLSSSTVSNPELMMENLNQYDSTAMFLLQAKNSLGCIAEDTILVTVQAKPNPKPTGKDSSLFCGQPFSAGYSVIGSPDATYQWKALGGLVDQGQGTSSIVINWDNTSNKSLSVTETISSGCAGTTIIPLNLDTLVIPITNVTKMENGQVNYITWKYNTASGLPKNILLQKVLPSGVTQTLTIPSTDSVYVDSVAIDPSQVYNYSISFIGKCGNEKSGKPHNNIALTYDKNLPNGTVPLSWNAYKNWSGGVGTYELWTKKNDEEYVLNKPIDPSTLSFDYSNSSDASLQCFKIKAVEGNSSGTYSWSNEICITTDYTVPNAISPNGDGINDTWIIDSKMFPGNELTIYNQWNGEVYNKKGYVNEWDGQGLPDGTYYFILKSKNKTLKGYILLMR